TLISGSQDRTVRLWETQTGRELRVFSGHQGAITAVAFAPVAGLVASGDADNTIHLWEAKTGKELHRFTRLPAQPDQRRGIRSLDFSPDATVLFAGHADGTLQSWATRSGKPLRTIQGFQKLATAAALSPEGTVLACAGSDEDWYRNGDGS